MLSCTISHGGIGYDLNELPPFKPEFSTHRIGNYGVPSIRDDNTASCIVIGENSTSADGSP